MSEAPAPIDPMLIREDVPLPARAGDAKQKSLEELNDAFELEKVESERSLLAAQTRKQVQDLAEVSETSRRRKLVAKAIFFGTVAWLAAVLGVVLLQGFAAFDFSLGDGVLIALLTTTTTTATVIGITLVVMAWLFPRS